jgi:energy-coupling factor transporter ATP-binding protein EcfA2
MSAWDAYPARYRENEVNRILAAVRGGECAAVIGLSGAGKSNLMGFLYQRIGALAQKENPTFLLVDGNRAQPRTADGLFRLIGQALESSPVWAEAGVSAIDRLEAAAARRMGQRPPGPGQGMLCLLLDRYDALGPEERGLASGPLRALRDSFKYQLTYVIAARRPPDPADELAELFYANTLWLGPLSPEDAHWSAAQYAGRHGLDWDEAILSKLVSASWGYPALLRACCEAFAAGNPAAGAALDIDALRAHPAVQRRVQEFWADGPTAEDLRRSGLAGQPLLSAAQPAVSAESPDLTASEHRLLACFQAHPGEVCNKDDLIRAVWPEDRVIDGLRDDSLAQLIRRLRQKIGAERIQTIPGRGYRYTAG